ALVRGDLGVGAGRGRAAGVVGHGRGGRDGRRRGRRGGPARGRGTDRRRFDAVERGEWVTRRPDPPERTEGSPVPDARLAIPADDPDAVVTERDLETLAEQLGRTPRGVVGIAARCACGRPLVVRTAPRLENGTPFPTTFYLTSPGAVAAASTLEANGVMKEMSQRLTEDAELAAAYRRAHEHYLAEREALGHVEEIDGISAGGMPTRVKCLHVLVG